MRVFLRNLTGELCMFLYCNTASYGLAELKGGGKAPLPAKGGIEAVCKEACLCIYPPFNLS